MFYRMFGRPHHHQQIADGQEDTHMDLVRGMMMSRSDIRVNMTLLIAEVVELRLADERCLGLSPGAGRGGTRRSVGGPQ